MIRLIPRETAWRRDGADLVEVEIENGLQRLSGCGVVEGFEHGFEPLGILGLQSDELGTASCQRCQWLRRSAGRR
jgi:hypothetical protein